MTQSIYEQHIRMKRREIMALFGSGNQPEFDRLQRDIKALMKLREQDYANKTAIQKMCEVFECRSLES
jgi:hypothetical protein|tara:strand:- start:438 stop:641 length:204 start_codon:yes stop_codon:yes gene_type:complete